MLYLKVILISCVPVMWDRWSSASSGMGAGGGGGGPVPVLVGGWRWRRWSSAIVGRGLELEESPWNPVRCQVGGRVGAESPLVPLPSVIDVPH